MHRFASKQQGLALIMAIMLVGFAIALIASISLTGSYENSLGRQIFSQAKLEAYVLSAETVGISVLKEDNRQVDTCDEQWAQLLVFPADKGFDEATFTVSIEDAQANYNINRLVKYANPDWQVVPLQVQALENYLNDQLDIPKTKVATPVSEIAASLADWIDSDDVPILNGRESFDYEGFNVPNNPIVSMEEIFAHPFFEAHEHRFGWMSSTVSVEMTALPPATPININTAPTAILKSVIFDGRLLSSAEINDIEGLKAKKITSVNSLGGLKAFDNATVNQLNDLYSQLTVASEYFHIFSQVELGEQVMILRTLVKRDQNGNITVLERRFSNPWPQQPFLNPSPC